MHSLYPQACQRGHSQHLEHLLFYGAEPGAQNASGNTALHICALYNKVSPSNIHWPLQRHMLHTSSLKPPTSATSVPSPFPPPLHPSTHSSIYPFTYLSTHLSIYLPIHPSTHSSTTYPFIHPSTHPLIHPPIHPPIYKPITYPSIHLPTHSSIHYPIITHLPIH